MCIWQRGHRSFTAEFKRLATIEIPFYTEVGTCIYPPSLVTMDEYIDQLLAEIYPDNPTLHDVV